MMTVMSVFQLFLGVVVTNGLYSITFADFHSACHTINETLVYASVPTAEILEEAIVGINQEEFETSVATLLAANLRQSKAVASYYYYNHDGSTCGINQCDSVQLRLATNHALFKIQKVYNYQLLVNA